MLNPYMYTNNIIILTDLTQLLFLLICQYTTPKVSVIYMNSFLLGKIINIIMYY